MKKLSKNTSPFLLLILPFFVVMAVMALHAGSELIIEKIQLSASFIKFPEYDLIRVFFSR